jgi:arylsulfatase A-like enzyme
MGCFLRRSTVVALLFVAAAAALLLVQTKFMTSSTAAGTVVERRRTTTGSDAAAAVGSNNNYDAAAAHPEEEIRNSAANNDNDNSNNTATTTTATTKPERLNIVLFYADDWTVNALGIFNDKVLTPNLDAMARRGMAFTHNCVTTSICWMSRATKYTGLYSSVHKQLKVSSMSMFEDTVRWNDTLYPKLFAAGYHTGHVGKWHAPMPHEYRKHTFHTFKNYYGSHWEKRDGKRTHVTECNRLDALEYLRGINGSLARGKIRNFALTVSFFAPHAMDGNPWPTAYMPDNYSKRLYRNVSKTFPIPKTATQAAWKKMPWFFNDKSEARRRWRDRFRNETYRQESIERVYRMLTEIDRAVGDVMEEVRTMGVYDKTLFVFTTDNGVFYGGTCCTHCNEYCRRPDHYSYSHRFFAVAEHGLADKVTTRPVQS